MSTTVNVPTLGFSQTYAQDMSIEQAVTLLSVFNHDVSNLESSKEGDTITFAARTGTKGNGNGNGISLVS